MEGAEQIKEAACVAASVVNWRLGSCRLSLSFRLFSTQPKPYGALHDKGEELEAHPDVHNPRSDIAKRLVMRQYAQ